VADKDFDRDMEAAKDAEPDTEAHDFEGPRDFEAAGRRDWEAPSDYEAAADAAADVEAHDFDGPRDFEGAREFE
jgi:hypothetical protein